MIYYMIILGHLMVHLSSLHDLFEWQGIDMSLSLLKLVTTVIVYVAHFSTLLTWRKEFGEVRHIQKF